MTYLECVIRIFRSLAVIRGDTDAPTSFSQTQLNSELQVAQLAIQNELINLVAKRLIPKERKTSGSISLVAGTAEYDLASDFIRLYGKPHFHNSSTNFDIFEYRGGLPQLQIDDINYLTAQGDPLWFYFSPQSSTNKKVGFYTVPNQARTLQYDYEGSVLITLAADNLPFHNDEECFTFTEMAARRYKFMWEDVKAEADVTMILEKDMSYRTARATVYQLLRGTNPSGSYGAAYR
jgi:hypothetical protein